MRRVSALQGIAWVLGLLALEAGAVTVLWLALR